MIAYLEVGTLRSRGTLYLVQYPYWWYLKVLYFKPFEIWKRSKGSGRNFSGPI